MWIRSLWHKFREQLRRLTVFRSLKTRFFIIFLLVGIITSISVRSSILRNYEERAISVRTSDVQNQFKILANHLITYGYLQDTSSEIINAELEQFSNLYDGRVLIIDKNFKFDFFRMCVTIAVVLVLPCVPAIATLRPKSLDTSPKNSCLSYNFASLCFAKTSSLLSALIALEKTTISASIF